MNNLQDQFRVHETEKDRIRQNADIRKLAAFLGVRPEFSEAFTTYDAKLFDPVSNRCTAVVEAKHRNNNMNKYRTLAIDKAKVDKLLSVAKSEDAQAVLLVSWDDGLRYLSMMDAYGCLSRVTRLKRGDRNERADLVYEIDTRWFHKVGSKPEGCTCGCGSRDYQEPGQRLPRYDILCCCCDRYDCPVHYEIRYPDKKKPQP